MEDGVHGAPGVPVIARQGRRQEQDNAITQHLSMVVQHAQDLLITKLHVQVHILLGCLTCTLYMYNNDSVILQLMEGGVHGAPGVTVSIRQEK